jgi:hypothetical protein
MSMFSSVYFAGQAGGAAACATMIDAFGYRVVFGVIALGGGARQ